MYADRVEATSGRSIKDRLNGNSTADPTRRRQITGKRQRQDDKWEHDLYDEDEPRVSNRKVSGQDLRLKLQKKNSSQASQSVKSSASGMRDLREKLSVEVPEPEIKKVASIPPRKKSQQKADSSVEGFLHSIGLEKYLITFQAEEVDMTALNHMNDDDLKAIGIPMGPRKKILLALESRG
ncbi:Sterile alpha motif (SAM) domain-containing protein [Euphorbia peplus]|nr:Sterile alpha motif (SAM) domain-containing protein [Euphorbia peplus]